ncbi:hypothetical protein V1525DRAFT_370336 [Lipomyces kononenkoae]|uniref:Uncharacterized protein n=1 Tax=Lipomyces kononenkoae TaxID=34357 RepID=A0ACC3T9Z4_LIPKO
MQIQFTRPKKRQKILPTRSVFDDKSSGRHGQDEQLPGEASGNTNENVHDGQLKRTQGIERYRPVFLPGQDQDHDSEKHESTPEYRSNGNDDSSEDEYMKMTIPDLPQQRVSEMTYSERRKRAVREQEAKSITRPPEFVQREKLEQGLGTSLLAGDKGTNNEDESSGNESVALSIMKKMGFVPGHGLGKGGDASSQEPLRPVLKYDRAGIGMVSAQREQIQSEAKRAQEAEQEEKQSFIDRKRDEQLEKRISGQIREAQRICQELDVSNDARLESILYSHGRASGGPNSGEYRKLDIPTLRSVNFLWRELVVERQNTDYEKFLRSRILDRPSSVDDDDEQENMESRVEEFVPEDYIDEELEAFNNLESAKKLEVLLEYLRVKFYYCFWCGCKYEDRADLEQYCPGITEEDHE